MEVVRVSETWQRAAVYYIRINAFVKGQNIPLNLEFDEGDGEQAKYILLLDNQEPVATARLHIIDDKTVKIERVCVAAEYRKKGVGRQLIEAAEDWAKDFGVKKIIITSQKHAVGFYEAVGYTADYNIQFDSSIPIVYTEKNI
ncbi:MAG: hypothetical protein K0Q85_795 [Caproiciproducens sp.]|nr:hypothetical protein [Caproiciproducens sp.]